MECGLSEAVLDSVVKHDFSTSQLAVIRTHMEIESPLRNFEGEERFYNYYPESYHPWMDWGHWSPTLWVDGLDDHCGVVGENPKDSLRTAYASSISTRLAEPSPLTIGLTVVYVTKSDTGTVHIEVVATEAVAFGGLTLRLALTESDIDANGIKDQVLRDYLPDQLGIPLTIAQGDTVTHAEPFVIDPTWVEGNCHLVAFVQDDATREVVQAVQVPVIASAPAPPAVVGDLTITLSGDDILLLWSPVTADINGAPVTVDHYRVYRDTVSVFGPGSDPFDSTVVVSYLDQSGVVGDTGTHYFYAVTAVAGEKESDLSGVVGEFDRPASAGK